MKTYERFCLCCRKKLTNASVGGTLHQFGDPPADAITCRSRGNFGSRQFDPPPSGLNKFIEFYVCDACLKEAGELGIVRWIVEKPLPVEPAIDEAWKPWETRKTERTGYRNERPA